MVGSVSWSGIVSPPPGLQTDATDPALLHHYERGRVLSRLLAPSLELQQPAFQLRPAAEAAETAAAGQHAVAGDHDRERVPAHSSAHGAGRARVAGEPRQLAVGDHLAVRDAA